MASCICRSARQHLKLASKKSRKSLPSPFCGRRGMTISLYAATNPAAPSACRGFYHTTILHLSRCRHCHPHRSRFVNPALGDPFRQICTAALRLHCESDSSEHSPDQALSGSSSTSINLDGNNMVYCILFCGSPCEAGCNHRQLGLLCRPMYRKKYVHRYLLGLTLFHGSG